MGRTETPIGTRSPAKAWTDEFDGALGEAAVAYWLKVPWEPKFGTEFDFDAPDLPGMEVKTGRYTGYRLRFRPKEINKAFRRGGRWFVFVMLDRREWPWTAEVMGIWHSHFPKPPEWLEDPHGWGPVWFVPTEALYPCRYLPLAQGRFD